MYSLLRLAERRCLLAISAKISSEDGPSYRPGQAAVSDEARAWCPAAGERRYGECARNAVTSFVPVLCWNNGKWLAPEAGRKVKHEASSCKAIAWIRASNLSSPFGDWGDRPSGSRSRARSSLVVGRTCSSCQPRYNMPSGWVNRPFHHASFSTPRTRHARVARATLQLLS